MKDQRTTGRREKSRKARLAGARVQPAIMEALERRELLSTAILGASSAEPLGYPNVGAIAVSGNSVLGTSEYPGALVVGAAYLAETDMNFAVAQPPVGHLDAVTNAVVKGWAVDPDSPTTSLTVRVNIDGATAGTVVANISRPGLVATFGSANHGFSFAMPLLSPGLHLVNVYAIDAETGKAQLLTSREIAGQPPAAPSNLKATALSSSSVTLTWILNSSNATGEYVERWNGSAWSVIATMGGAATSYTDSGLAPGHSYSYNVVLFNSAGSASANSSASVTLPDTNSTVTVTTRYGNELVITASGAKDTILVVQSGSSLTITADGQKFVDSIPSAGLFIYTRGGVDTVTLDKTLAIRTTVESIDNAATVITSAAVNVSAWIDSTDVFTGTGVLHRIASFAGGVSKALGASLTNPTDAGPTTIVNRSLWGTGPVMGDVNQGEVGDCYFMASLAAFANDAKNLLTQRAVDMGDGTFVVQYNAANGSPVYIRVNHSFSTGYFDGFNYAYPGVNNTIWAMVMEKAFAFFRTGANTYASISAGWMGEVYQDLGRASNMTSPSICTASAFYSLVSSELAAGKPVTLGTGSAPDLVSGHAYTLVSASVDASGITHYVVRNPWGSSGDALENSQGYATLTFEQLTANFIDICYAL